ncbi:hypothetical protein GJ496_006100 [Pomphorhynchus laevis]|nr:hypothetical protein GJ496_006100 [Pomphorhynchus laevis]
MVENINCFVLTKTGILGKKRTSMLRNHLLLKPPLGRASIRGHDIPCPHQIFGRRENYDYAEQNNKMKKRRNLDSKPEKNIDYITLQKCAIENGMITSRQLNQFKNAQLTINKINGGCTVKPKGPCKPDNLCNMKTFGKPERIESNIKEVLHFHFANKWLLNMTKKVNKMNIVHKSQIKPSDHYVTKATLLRQKEKDVPSKDLWKLERFKRIPAVVNSYRSAAEAKRATDNETMKICNDLN